MSEVGGGARGGGGAGVGSGGSGSGGGGDDTAGRFDEVFGAIADGAVEGELGRELAHGPVEALKASGFTALRVPTEFGGSGCSLPAFFALLVDLATADSNVAHLLRGHFAFVEILLLKPESAYRSGWLRAIANGAIVGNAASETTGNSLADIQTTLSAVDDRLLLNGTKYYSTGTLYSSHVYVAAARGDERVTCVVPTGAAGVTMLDDWDGFGQRLTASGTTVFENVEVDPLTVSSYSAGGASHLGAFFQLVLVSVAAGISAAVLRDAVAFVRPRKRTYISANSAAPRDDPQVRAVVGQLSSLAFTDRALVLAAADALARATAPRASRAPAPTPRASGAVTAAPRASGAVADGEPDDRTALLDAAEIATYQAQVRVLDDALQAATLLFEVGGASATARTAALDRHWRNARTVASHNPAVYKLAQLGDWELNGVGPTAMWERLWAVGPTAPA